MLRIWDQINFSIRIQVSKIPELDPHNYFLYLQIFYISHKINVTNCLISLFSWSPIVLLCTTVSEPSAFLNKKDSFNNCSKQQCDELESPFLSPKSRKTRRLQLQFQLIRSKQLFSKLDVMKNCVILSMNTYEYEYIFTIIG